MELQFITHFTAQYSYFDSAKMALDGGCRWIQLRMKDTTDDVMESVALRIQNLCRQHQATFIIDDNVKLALKLKADGVHLGKNDMPVRQARAILGPECIIGGTANTFQDICRLYDEGADYIGCGPFRFTETKKNLSPLLGLDGYRSLISQMKQQGISIPLVAIGGITRADIPSLLSAGIDGIALSGTILHADNPTQETRRILEVLRTHTYHKE